MGVECAREVLDDGAATGTRTAPRALGVSFPLTPPCTSKSVRLSHLQAAANTANPQTQGSCPCHCCLKRLAHANFHDINLSECRHALSAVCWSRTYIYTCGFYNAQLCLHDQMHAFMCMPHMHRSHIDFLTHSLFGRAERYYFHSGACAFS